MKLGYVRVSTELQNEERQKEKMLELGIEERNIYIDKSTGKNFNREQYNYMKCLLREGDELYLDSLDRLGRNYDEVKKEWMYITKELKCDVICLDMGGIFNSKKFRIMGDIGKLMEDMMLSVLSYVAEQELKKIHERQAEGIAIAKLKGNKYNGRPPIKKPYNYDVVVRDWLESRCTLKQAYTALGVSKATFLRWTKADGIHKVSAEQ